MSGSPSKAASSEVPVREQRRRFTAAYKRQIVEEAATCGYGELGALLRREGLYASHLSKWREEYASGSLSDKPRGPRPNPDAAEVKRLERENAHLRHKLEQAEAIIAAQKKLARLLESQTEGEAP
jgi:transposase